ATGLELDRGATRVACRKERDGWQVRSPIAAAADSLTLDRILKDLADARIERTLTDAAPTGQRFGLDRPTLVTLEGEGRRAVLAVGGESPTGDLVYARRDGGPVLLVRGQLREVAAKTLYDLRDKTVLDVPADDVLRITFENRGRAVRLVREATAAQRA